MRKIYHIRPEDFRGFVGTLRHGGVSRGHIMSVLTRRGDHYEVAMPDGTVHERIPVGDAGRAGQVLRDHIDGA